MGFVRQQAENWRRDVPGARWFKADLHIRTIDDAPSGAVLVPADIDVASPSPEQLDSYARQFLDAAVANGVQVLGITPTCPRLGTTGGLSAAWHIVEEWNRGSHDNGRPYREQVFAVFPGFMPRLNDGRGDLDLIFLFDPEVGRERYLQLYDLMMQGRQPWNGEQVASAQLSADEAFGLLRENRLHDETADGARSWDFLALAPNAFSETGLLGTPGEHVEREGFDVDDLAALELPENLLPTEALQGKPWVNNFIRANRLTLFHSSAADSFEDIGKRHVWLKMAEKTIEALRQAFIAHTTRARIGHELDDDGSFRDLAQPPDALRYERPWLKSVTVNGEAAFFDSTPDRPPVEFEFSPDLTCVIGGSMTGKSTLLDGLRVHVGAQLPQSARARQEVKERAAERFLVGAPSIELNCPGRAPTVSAQERWPAVFYTQGELKSLTEDPEAVQNILARLDASETGEIDRREGNLLTYDRELGRIASRLSELDDQLVEAEQALKKILDARNELTAFADAGVEDFNNAAASAATWRDLTQTLDDIVARADDLISAMNSVVLPNSDTAREMAAERLDDQWQLASEAASNVLNKLVDAQHTAAEGVHQEETRREELRVQVDRALAAHGFDGERISEFQELSAQVSLLDSYQSNLDGVRATSENLQAAFEQQLAARRSLRDEQRRSFDKVLDGVGQQSGGHFAARRIDDGGSEPLEDFISRLSQRGITRWWNDSKGSPRPSPDELLRRLDDGSLGDVGMSRAVQQTFAGCITPARRRELAALRCPDRYVLEFRTSDKNYRPLDKLSGGQRVNLLLSLLLATSDSRPLVIDQPEDELDNRFLFETLLPALHRLKGRRQVIVATHNANIVVNGDADQVIQLDAADEHGYIACAGAIEDPTVREAIVQTVDGGDEAFRLRRIKYGF
ncbi:MAG: AAA family ATPase [Acidimicrobiales bacterium]|nr:AAA family ATPase [Acidimicrobiales bacterium]MYH75253.1 AAA family ATPase [Acidimicrobiales bacterium]MYK71082.1 AAA family ATPase [Acidimicrobiales bacterium]